MSLIFLLPIIFAFFLGCFGYIVYNGYRKGADLFFDVAHHFHLPFINAQLFKGASIEGRLETNTICIRNHVSLYKNIITIHILPDIPYPYRFLITNENTLTRIEKTGGDSEGSLSYSDKDEGGSLSMSDDETDTDEQ
jgi:hypothetical protein